MIDNSSIKDLKFIDLNDALNAAIKTDQSETFLFHSPGLFQRLWICFTNTQM